MPRFCQRSTPGRALMLIERCLRRRHFYADTMLTIFRHCRDMAASLIVAVAYAATAFSP